MSRKNHGGTSLEEIYMYAFVASHWCPINILNDIITKDTLTVTDPKGHKILQPALSVHPSVYLSVRPSVHPSVRPSLSLPFVKEALLFKLSLNNMEKWQKAVYGQGNPCSSWEVCYLSWGGSRPGSGFLRPETWSQRPISWSQSSAFKSLGPGLGSLRPGFRCFRPEPGSQRPESGSQRSRSGLLRLGCGF